MAGRFRALAAGGLIVMISLARRLVDVAYREIVAVIIMAFGVGLATAAAWLAFMPGAGEGLAAWLLQPLAGMCQSVPAACQWPAPLAIIAGGLIALIFPTVYLIRAVLIAGYEPAAAAEPTDPQARMVAAIYWATRYRMGFNSAPAISEITTAVSSADDLDTILKENEREDLDPQRPILIHNWPTYGNDDDD